jgi:hypothetical protein
VTGVDTPVRPKAVGAFGALAEVAAAPGRTYVASASTGEPHDAQKRESSGTADEQVGQDGIGGL